MRLRQAGSMGLLLLWSTLALAGPREDALAAFDKFFLAFLPNNHGPMAALFAPDALFYGTGSTQLVTAPAGVIDYFRTALDGTRGEVRARAIERTALELSDSVVVISGKWHTERTHEGKTAAGAPLRVTAVMHKRGEQWLIAQFHNSPLPKPPAASAR